MNLQSIVEHARFRDNAFAEICKALDELDAPTLERILVYAADRREAFSRGDPRIRLVVDDIPGVLENSRYAADAKDDAKKRIARAEKGVRTRKANAAKKKGAKNTIAGKPMKMVTDALRSDPKAGVTAKDIVAYTKLSISNVYAQLKKLGAYSNGMGRFWVDKKAYLANFPIAGKKNKKLANGVAEKSP